MCHNDVASDHEAVWAKRQVCGYCSKEQPLGDRCTGCDRRLASRAANPAGRNTRFWEGGQGCRDPNKLSRRDPHRYKNSKSKTRSAKAKRVGPKS